MSIINETLTRLELDNPVPARRLDRSRLTRPARKSMGLAVKLLATATLAVFAGTSLMVWHWNDRLESPTLLPQAEAGSRRLPGRESIDQPSPGPIGEQTSTSPQTSVPASETLTTADQPALALGPKPEEAVSKADEPRMRTNGPSLPARSGEEPLAAANVKRGAVSAEGTESAPGPAASHRAEKTVVASAPTWEEVMSEIGGKPSQPKISSLPAQSAKKTVDTTHVKARPVKARTAKAEPAPAVPEKRQRTEKVAATSHAAQPSPVDEVVEQARSQKLRGF